MEMIAKDYYIKQKVREREQDNRETETERERMLEAECCRGRKIALAIK
jgi:hypothetical protein